MEESQNSSTCCMGIVGPVSTEFGPMGPSPTIPLKSPKIDRILEPCGIMQFWCCYDVGLMLVYVGLMLVYSITPPQKKDRNSTAGRQISWFWWDFETTQVALGSDAWPFHAKWCWESQRCCREWAWNCRVFQTSKIWHRSMCQFRNETHGKNLGGRHFPSSLEKNPVSVGQTFIHASPIPAPGRIQNSTNCCRAKGRWFLMPTIGFV